MIYPSLFTIILFSIPILLCALMVATLIINAMVIFTLRHQRTNLSFIRHSYHLFLILFLGQLFENASWLILSIHEIFLHSHEYHYKTIMCLTYLGQFFIIMQYSALAYLIQALINQHYQKKISEDISMIATILVATYLFYSAITHQFFLHQNVLDITQKNAYSFQSFITYTLSFIILNLIIAPRIYDIVNTIGSNKLAKMIRQHLKIFLNQLVMPFLLGKFIIGSSFMWHQDHLSLYCLASISTFALAAIFYHAFNKILQLSPSPILSDFHHSEEKIKTIINFQVALAGLANAQSIESVNETTFLFFKEEFAISPRALSIQIIKLNTNTEVILNRFLKLIAAGCAERQKNILISDELAFDLFYENNYRNQMLLNFLRDNDSDVFVPIYYQAHAVGYLKIMFGSRQHDYYNLTEQNSMLTFASYLGSVINVFYNNSIDLFLNNEKKIKNELYLKHQEITLYQESTKTSFPHKKNVTPRIVLYKKGTFTCFNHEAKQSITFTIVEQENDQLAQACIFIVEQVMQKQSMQSHLIEDNDGTPLLIQGASYNDEQEIIISIVPAHIGDHFAHSYQYLSTDTDILYLLYLERTSIGKHITHLLPGTGPTLLPTKIALLRTILGKNSLFLDTHEADATFVLQLIAQANPALAFYVIEPEELLDLNKAIPADKKQKSISFIEAHAFLTKKFSSPGIFFIKNIDLVDQIMQAAIATFIKYGATGTANSNSAPSYHIRLLIAGKKNLIALYQEQLIHHELFAQLKDDTFILPTPATLTESELFMLIKGFVNNVNHHQNKEKILLTNDEKSHIHLQCPASLHDFYRIVAHTVKRKMKFKKTIEPYQLVEQYFDAATATYLDKQALKEKDTLSTLWQRFKSYHKIATFLGVHASSVQRRCKQFGIPAPTMQKDHLL